MTRSLPPSQTPPSPAHLPSPGTRCAGVPPGLKASVRQTVGVDMWTGNGHPMAGFCHPIPSWDDKLHHWFLRPFEPEAAVATDPQMGRSSNELQLAWTKSPDAWSAPAGNCIPFFQSWHLHPRGMSLTREAIAQASPSCRCWAPGFTSTRQGQGFSPC